MRVDLAARLEQAGEKATDQVLHTLRAHLTLLARWNQRYSLTAIRSWEQILDRHLREALLPLRWIAPTGCLLDIGTGNGFPAIPLLACRSRLEAVLVERSERKSLFLDAVVRESGLRNVRIETSDILRWEPDGGQRSPSSAARRPARSKRPAASDERTASSLERKAAGRGAEASEARGSAADRGSGFDYIISRAALPAEKYLALSRRWAKRGGRIFLYAGESVPDPGSTLDLAGLRLVDSETIADRRDCRLLVFEAD